MSIKKYFEVAENIQSLANKSVADIGSVVESAGYHEQDIIEEERFIPRVDFSKPENFARYGSAEEYYAQSIKRIYNTYPYDGSLKERLEWVNESTYLDLYIYDEKYPRTNGYIIMSADSVAAPTSYDGYGRPTVPEYIYVEGGPNPNPNGSTSLSTQFTGSNYYEPSMNRASNLELNFASKGVSLEFWLKKTEFFDREVIFDLWNGELSSSDSYARLRLELTGNLADGSRPFLLTARSGSAGVDRTSLAAATVTSASVADGNWHHYAVTVKSSSLGVATRFYVDGALNKESMLTGYGHVGVNNVNTFGLRANIGALVTSVSGSPTTAAADGKLSGSLDEFRFWKAQRTSEQIGLYWFTQVGGGVNTDPEPFIETMESGNVDLGVYFKFNEGITGVAATDSIVLDYSGRFSNGAWTGYTSNSRNTGSAMVLSTAATKEFKDPIIYSFNPEVVALAASLQFSGSAYDVNNNASIYNSVPAWITEEDTEGENNLKYLTQIMSSYFDTLHSQIDSLNLLKDKQYPSGSDKPLPFAENLLYSQGFVAPELFLDADILEKLADRSDQLLFEKSLHDIKNTIYQNIYNNLSYIYKTKGTMKSFRNLIRCFGIDEELIKLNMYADNVEYQIANNRRNIVIANKFVDFNTISSTNATVYNYKDPLNSNSVGYIPAVSVLTGGYGITLEANIIFPLKQDEASSVYANTNVISSSLFGMHGTVAADNDTRWPSSDRVNFQVYAERDEVESANIRFVLTGTAGGFVPRLTSDLYQEVYNNTQWNIAVRIKPETYPLKNFVSSTPIANDNYIVELHGTQVQAGTIMEEFTVSQVVTAPPVGFITGSRRAYIGAHRTDFTGSILQHSDVKVGAFRYWVDYLDDETLKAHALDPENYGSLTPHQFAYGFRASASFGDIQKIDTLAFNWEFLTNTGSNTDGQFTVSDLSSGSADFTRFGAIGTILNKQYTASGSFFAPSSTKAFDKDYIVASKLNLPEQLYTEDMVAIPSPQEQLFTTESRPTNYYFAFEKSMYQVISEEMINYFANLKDFHNLIGAPVESYRVEYKQLKVLRHKFFEKIGNSELDFDKFYEFYKWFDSALSIMLAQLVPASADFADNIITVIENHVLERPKYRRKFPFLEKVGGTEPSTTAGWPWYPMTVTPPAGAIFSGMQSTRRQTGQSDQNITNWKDVHAPLPKPGEDLPREDEKLYWHKLDKLLAEDDPRFALQKSIRKSYKRRIGSPVKLDVQGVVTYGGVGRHSSNRPNYVFAATAPYGPVVPSTNIPTNVMIGYGSDVEQLIDTTDVFYPSRKQRLGFGMDPGINNTPDEIKLDGNIYAPFSIYSSSVETGYNSKVVTQYKSGTMVTNLHNDFVQNHDVPMQGPFAEKFVGGRYYRHTEVNDGTDTRENRAEGFLIVLGEHNAGNSLAVVPPNSGTTALGWDAALPTAQRFRDETAKRPVNIKNILMTTASIGYRLSGTIVHNQMGNYQKNYQVINTGGRTINDPFFQDQSFNFALNPETLATRGRFPLTYDTTFTPITGKSYLFDGSNDYASSEAYTATTWNGLIGSSSVGGTKPYSMSAWIYVNTWTGNDAVIAIGRTAYLPGGREIRLYDNGGTSLGIRGVVGGNNYKSSDTDMVTGQWYHIVVTYAGMAAGYGGATVLPDIYIDGADDGDGGNVSTLSHVQSIATIPLQLGYNATPGNGYFDGYMCGVAIYDKELSSTEVTELYNGGQRANPLQSSFSVNTLVYYPMGNLAGDDNADIYDLADNDGLFANNFAIDAIKEVSPSTLTQDQFPSLFSSVTGEPSPNPGGNLNYELPNRTGANSNQTIIVNRFSSPGEYSTLSRGYMEPAHEELSVNNASPYRNRRVINFGFPGSASLDPSIENTIRVVDQISKNRGLNQLATLHAGQFGYDSAYGSIATIDQFPSWQKTNKNRKRRIVESSPGSYETGSVYDNLFVQHAIPRSTQQYSWVTGSMISGTAIFGLSKPSCFSASVLTELVTSGTYASANFVGLNTLTIDPVSASSHLLGFPLTSVASSSYYNSALGLGLNNGADYLNVLLDNRGGAFGYSTWKQIRAGESSVARKLRETNKIGITIAPRSIPNIIGGRQVGFIQPTQPNTFVDYFEAPVSKNSSPIYFYFEDNTDESNVANNLILTVPYRNELDYFSNNGLNNRLGLQIDLDKRRAYSTVVDYTLSSDMSVVVNYSERLYPSAMNAYKPIVRGRTEFTITNIWDDSRVNRSITYGGQVDSMGQTVASSSTWPMDGHLNFTTISSVNATDGAGELMNSYSRFSGSDSGIAAAPTYAMRIPVGTTGSGGGSFPVLVGDAEWLAPSQAGKNPYENYNTYAETIRLIGKDYSIIPEFRISELMDTYVNAKESDFLASLDNIFSLTGAAISNSTESNFYKTYTNADFLRYFSVIDDDLNEQRSGNLKIIRDKVALKCDALIKFLPYKGFYPAERTLELAQLLSQSYGKSLNATTSSLRILMEPMYAPGIMFNTIKSGLAVSNFVLANTSSFSGVGATAPGLISQPSSSFTPRQTYEWPRSINQTADNGTNIIISSSVPLNAPIDNLDGGQGYVPSRVPFEALYQPESFFNPEELKALPITSSSDSCVLYDTAISGSPSSIGMPGASSGQPYLDFSAFKGDKRYRLAIDNFLSEVTTIFVDEQANFQSRREERFKTVFSGSTYSMRFKIYRPGQVTPRSSALYADPTQFIFYDNECAYGTPLVAANSTGGLTFSHVSPPHYGGAAYATYQYTAIRSGIPTLDEIFASTEITFTRDTDYGNSVTARSVADIVMQVDSCFNLTDIMQEVPPGTVTQKDKWLIQSKFETPILNFVSVTSSAPPTSSVTSLDSADDYKIKGMWHQYGVIPTGSAEGVFAVVEGASGSASGNLADIVGFPVGKPVRLGTTKKEYKLEEAIIAIPYREAKNRRNFIRIQGKNKTSSTYAKTLAAMDKYIFPPKFDFTRFDTVEPILMYIFEFSADLTQQDIADIWQNLPPDLGEKFETKEAVVEEKELIDLILNKDTDTKWMVFKVKKRAKKDFEIVRRQQVQEDTSAMTPNITSEYSYNWPYDYFSLVELAKIDEQVQYVSTDLKQTTRLSENEALDVQRTTNASITTGRSAPPAGLPSSGGQAPGETNTPAQPSRSSAGKKTVARAVARTSRRNRKGNK